MSRLEILTFESADVGDYQMVVSNEVGKVTTKALAKLKGKRELAGKWRCGLESFEIFEVLSLCFCRATVVHKEG